MEVTRAGRAIWPPPANAVYAPASSRGVAPTVPRAMEGSRGISGPSPARRAVDPTRRVPTADATRTAGTFLERTRASRRVISPSKRPSKFCGSHTSPPASSMRSGSSTIRWVGEKPRSSAVAKTKGLKALPTCRRARVARLKRESP